VTDQAPKIVGILQARVSSSRLPAKVLLNLLGRPMLSRQIERVRRSHRLTELVVATSTDRSDDPIEALCREEGVNCYRGSLSDVLDRYYQAAKLYQADIVVRLTGDCPLAEPAVIDAVIDFFMSQQVDYASNTIEPTFPDGLDVEVFSFLALEIAWREARKESEREHVTPFIHQHANRFRLANFRNDRNLSGLRWTVDEPQDFEVVRRVYEGLYPRNPAFSATDVLKYLHANPELEKANQGIERNAGYKKSLQHDVQNQLEQAKQKD